MSFDLLFAPIEDRDRHEIIFAIRMIGSGGDPAPPQRPQRPAAADRPGSRNLVNSLAKGLRVLESFRGDRLEMTVTETARAADLDPGTAFRLLNTLATLGYVERVTGSKRFRLSLKAADLGLNAIGEADLRDIARPILRSLVGEVNEAASFGVLDGGDILYLERVRAGLARLAVDIRIGTTVPASCSTIGHAVLAFLPPEKLERVLATAPRAGNTLAVSLPREVIEQSLADIRRSGSAVRDSYLGNGLRVLAVPVLDSDGHPLGAVSVATPAFSITLTQLAEHALEPVRRAAARIARAVQIGAR
jgi:IclR family pca regulon transcriptional regulator